MNNIGLMCPHSGGGGGCFSANFDLPNMPILLINLPTICNQCTNRTALFFLTSVRVRDDPHSPPAQYGSARLPSPISTQNIHTIAVESLDAVKRYLPAGDAVTTVTAPMCPVNDLTCLYDGISNI